MGIGMFLSVKAMVIAAVTDTKRLKISRNPQNLSSETVPMSIFWLLLQYILLRISDIFTVVGMQEFFYSEVLVNMRTLGIALYTSVFGFGSFFSPLLISIVEHFTSSTANPIAMLWTRMESNQNISGSGTGPLPSSTVDEQGVQTPGIETSAQQPMATPKVPAVKKRKEIESRSIVWEHFEQIKDPETQKVLKGKCLYYAKEYFCETKKHGTSSLRNHMGSCLKNPHSKDIRQSLLTFNTLSTSEGGTEAPVGVLGTWVFNQDAIRRALCEMIIIHELPFRFVEGQGFKRFILVACPRFLIPSRWTISRDIYQIFLDERLNLKKLFRVGTQRGEYIAKALESCLLEWGIKNVFTVTVDNASFNDTAMGFFKSKLLSWGSSSVKVQYMHMRCIAHILNLVVQDGLKFADESVKRVRDAVRWVRNSPARLTKFREFAELFGVEAKSALHLDVPTRWNSTYIMLNIAIQYQVVFDAYERNDPSYSADLGSAPTFLDWCSVESLVKLLKAFYDMTVRISGSLYVTSNTFFSEISDLSCMLEAMVNSEQGTEKAMGTQMRNKDKLEYMPHQFVQLYGEEKGKACFTKFQSAMAALYDDYAATYSLSSTQIASSTQVVQSEANQATTCTVGRPQSSLKSQLKKKKRLESSGSSNQTELQVYLSESLVEDDESVPFDVLKWWKSHSERFPILSKMARDVLAVPISTVASESCFSTSGRVLDPFRSSLTPKIVEALICTQDWLRAPNQPIQVEENLEEVERLEKELPTGASSTIPSMFPTITVILNVFVLFGGYDEASTIV
ncbi:PREDICTED: zinc finger BED domain-containing protein RICESLEEPER 2-like [Ipomoea nil]|uniref:zinc finger BED domain-containing protein RICESLEEPER 2-like n=1 Tax=Ipomoea nil TaxID=35883 RepID=UPI00090199F9|nr:PREDICTED: zinc finger BED domain-containing protein RICESLEEPER 2-like [Ipomoea nil]